MLQLNPQHRYDIADVIGHPWMQGPIATPEQVRHEMRKRRNATTNLVQDHEFEMKSSKASKSTRRNIFGQRDADMKMKLYTEDENNTTSFFSDFAAEEIENDLFEALNSYGVSFTVHHDKRKIVFSQEK